MEPLKKSILIMLVLILVSAYLTLYTVTVHSLAASHIVEDSDGGVWWRTTPSGSLFLWPREPGMLQALSKMNEADLFIYQYLIKPWVLVGVLILMWGVSVLCLLIRPRGRYT